MYINCIQANYAQANRSAKIKKKSIYIKTPHVEVAMIGSGPLQQCASELPL